MGSQTFGPSPDHGEIQPPTKYEREEYHDFLEAFINADFFDELPKSTQQAVLVCRDTLCWTQGHVNGAFEVNMQQWSDFFKNRLDISDSFYN